MGGWTTGQLDNWIAPGTVVKWSPCPQAVVVSGPCRSLALASGHHVAIMRMRNMTLMMVLLMVVMTTRMAINLELIRPSC